MQRTWVGAIAVSLDSHLSLGFVATIAGAQTGVCGWLEVISEVQMSEHGD